MRRLLLLLFLVSPAFADISMDRTPASDRGSLALMVVHCGAALFVIAKVMRHGFGGTLSEPVYQLSPGFTRAFQFALGVSIAVILTQVVQWLTPLPPLPPGWSTLRPLQEVSALARKGNIVYAGGQAGLTAIDRTTSQLRDLPRPSHPFRYVKELLVDRQGDLWVAHGRGVSQLKNGAWVDYSAAEGLPAGAALAVLEDRDGSIWIGTEKGIASYDGHSFIRRAGLDGRSINTIFQDRAGVMWFGSDDPRDGGLFRYDGTSWREYTTADGLIHRSVNAIGQDPSGALWVATGFGATGGVNLLEGERWSAITQRDGLARGKDRTVFFDRSGRTWIGSEYSGIAVAEDGAWHVLTPQQGLAGWEVKRMLEDPDGVLWLGTENGISRIPGNRVMAQAGKP